MGITKNLHSNDRQIKIYLKLNKNNIELFAPLKFNFEKNFNILSFLSRENQTMLISLYFHPIKITFWSDKHLVDKTNNEIATFLLMLSELTCKLFSISKRDILLFQEFRQISKG